jgi:2-oxoisovalerate dehydrogenase E1 component alpha subunit
MNQPRHKSLGLTDEEVLEMYEMMLRARKLDERLWLLHRSGKVSFIVSCQGQEAIQVAAAFALDRSKDYTLPYYRDVGMVLACGMTERELMLNNFGKAEDPNSGGRQMPNHFGQSANRIVTQSSPVSTQIPHAAGIALGGKIEGKDFVTLTTFGEGSSNQGDFHEGLNFASVHKLPCIFLCQNNKYAISVPMHKQMACENVADRAVGYGMPGETVDGNDLLSVYEVVKKAANHGRNGNGPTLIEAMCYRFKPHSSNDDELSYRERAEIDEAKKNDPITIFAEYLREVDVLTDELEEEISTRVKERVDDAVKYAENAPLPSKETVYDHVYAGGGQ